MTDTQFKRLLGELSDIKDLLVDLHKKSFDEIHVDNDEFIRVKAAKRLAGLKLNPEF